MIQQTLPGIALKRITYSSNNSGGSWWLRDEDWHTLEQNGWRVRWCRDEEDSLGRPYGERWLGALAKEASKEFVDMASAIAEFESLTGQSADDAGCSCCGKPHNFYDWE